MGLFFLYNIIILVILYITGSLLLPVALKNLNKQYTKIFSVFLVGILFYVVVFSVIKTRGNTIHIGFLILFVAGLVSRNKSFNSELGHRWHIVKMSKDVMLTTFVFSVVIFLLGYWFITDSGYNFPIIPNSDYVYYSRISDYLNRFGIESGIPDYLDADLNRALPYHYFELWFTSLVIFFTGAPAILIQELTSHTLFDLVICLGFLAVAEHYTKIGFREKIWALIFLFFNGLTFYYYPEKMLHPHFSMFVTNVITSQKTASISLFIICSLILMINNKTEWSIYAVLCLPILFITTAPAVFSAVMIFLIVSLRFDSLAINRFRIVLVTSLLFIFICSFYLLNKNLAVITSFAGVEDVLKIIRQSHYSIMNFCNSLGKSVIELIYIFFPFVLLIVIFNKIIFSSITNYLNVLLYGLLILTSIVSWSALNPMIDSIQLFSNLSVPLVNFGFFIVVYLMLVRFNNPFFRVFTVLVFMAWITVNVKNTIHYTLRARAEFRNSYSDAYLNLVSQRIKTTGKRGAIIFSPEDLEEFMGKKLDVYAYRNYLATVENGIDISALNERSEITFSTEPAIRTQEENVVGALHFQKFTEAQKQANMFKNIRQSRLDFINAYGIRFLFLTKGAEIDSVLQLKIKEKITDPVSGETFLILN